MSLCQPYPAKAAPPLLGFLFHIFPYILSWEYNTLSFPSFPHLIHISQSSQSSLGGRGSWRLPVPNSLTKLQFVTVTLSFLYLEKSFSNLFPELHPSGKTHLCSQGCLRAQALPEPPPWLFFLLHFSHSPDNGGAMFSSQLLGWYQFLRKCVLVCRAPLDMAAQGSASSQYAQECSGYAFGDVCLGIFKSLKLLGKKANIWCMNITHHPFLVFSSRPQTSGLFIS